MDRNPRNPILLGEMAQGNEGVTSGSDVIDGVGTEWGLVSERLLASSEGIGSRRRRPFWVG